MTKQCPCCGAYFDAETKRGRPFTYCETCRKKSPDARLQERIRREEASK